MRPRDTLRRCLHRLYERRLRRQMAGGKVPSHIGIILDGNRRHGAAQGLRDPDVIYALGARKLDEVLDWCEELGVGAVTLWVCSIDNLARAPQEVSGILRAVEHKMHALAEDPRMRASGVRVHAIGRLELLPPSLAAALDAAARATAAHDRMELTIAVGYGGREEIVDAVRSFLRAVHLGGGTLAEAEARISPEALQRHLYRPDLPDPDLIIRTSGEERLSGFLLWQSAYSEFYVTDVYWPAFRKIDFLRAIRSYQLRNRRFGR